MITEIPDNKWKYLTKKSAFLHEYLNSIHDYQKSVNNLQKEYFFSKIKNKCPRDRAIERRKEIINLFNIKHGEELTQLCLKSDDLLLAYVFGNFIEVFFEEFDINPSYCAFLPGYTYQCGLKKNRIKLQTLQNEDIFRK